MRRGQAGGFLRPVTEEQSLQRPLQHLPLLKLVITDLKPALALVVQCDHASKIYRGAVACDANLAPRQYKCH